MGEKTPKYKKENEKQGKNSPFGCPPIPPIYEMEADSFLVSKTLKTSQTYPKWERDPNLMWQTSPAPLRDDISTIPKV